MGDSWFAKQLFLYNMKLIEEIHDILDMNIVSALIHIMACNALLIFPIEQGLKVALNFVLIAETTCEVTGSTHSEVSNKFSLKNISSCLFSLSRFLFLFFFPFPFSFFVVFGFPRFYLKNPNSNKTNIFTIFIQTFPIT